MKKKLAASLALAFTLGIAGTAFAANPFVDVPAKHWSYDAVSKLAADGIVDGYGDGSFKGDKSMTRYEMATIVAKAMAKEEKANAEDKALIQKLSAEYSQELDNLGVRVSNLEKRVDNVTYNGKVRFRYDTLKEDGEPNNTSASNSYLDLFLNAQINDNWKAVAEIESNKQMTTGEDGGEKNTSKIYVVGNVGGTTVTAGKYGLMSNYGLLDDTKLNGAQVDFGSKLKTSIRAGHLDEVGTDKQGYAGAAFNYALSKNTNIIASYHHLNNDFVLANASHDAYAAPTDKNVNIYEVGFGTTLFDNVTFQGSYAKSNINGLATNESNKAYYTQLMYKAADSKSVGSFDVYAQYKKIPGAVAFAPTWDYSADYKAWQVGFDYVPTLNSKFTAFYQNGKSILENEDNKVYRAQIELYF